MRKILSLLAVGVAAMAMVSCENQDTDKRVISLIRPLSVPWCWEPMR